MMKYKVSNKKRFTVILICLCLFLLVSVGGTLAYLFTSGGSVKNIFTPAQVSTYVEEKLENGRKSEIKIQNTGNTSAFIRVAVVQNWVDESGNVIPGNLPKLPTALGSGWVLNSKDGFYYYKPEVAAGKETAVLFSEAITEPANKPAGTHLQVAILAEGIQSQGTDGTNSAVVDAWRVDPSSLK